MPTRQSLVLSLLGLILMSAAPSGRTFESKSESFRVLSFNIRFWNPADGDNFWPKRKDMVAGIMRFHQADLIGIQEALRVQIADLEALLPGFKWAGVGRDDGKEKGEFSAIFYRTSRFELLESSTFWLSETPDVPGSKSWDAAITRLVTWCRFRDLESGKVLFHFNTHFDHRGERAREESARLLIRRIREIAAEAPVVVTGDFNFNDTTPAYRLLTGGERESEGALKDAYNVSELPHYGPDTTFNGFREPVPNARIDYIMIRGSVRVLRHGILSEAWNGRFPSDHFPVLAELIVDQGDIGRSTTAAACCSRR